MSCSFLFIPDYAGSSKSSSENHLEKYCKDDFKIPSPHFQVYLSLKTVSNKDESSQDEVSQTSEVRTGSFNIMAGNEEKKDVSMKYVVQ